MKPMTLLLICLIFFSCSPEILKSNFNDNDLNIQPPIWIHGTWSVKDPDIISDKLKFSADDFKKINANNEETSVLAGYKLIQLLGGTVTVQEFNQIDQYILSFDYTDKTLGSGGEVYTFIRTAASELTWNGLVYTKI